MKLRIIVASLVVTVGVALGLTTSGFGGPRVVPPIAAGTTEANITRLTTTLLEHSQFAHHPLDTELAGALVDRYLDALDGARSLFLQSDVDEFARYRATLAEATRGAGDTSAARAIFGRYIQRLEQRMAFTAAALQSTKFDFTGHNVYAFDREHAQRPRDLASAYELWRQQLRAEYLQEKLGGKPPAAIASTLVRRHAQQLRTMKGLQSDEVLEIYLDALAHVYDPHSDYLGHEQMESLSIAMNLSLFGIGASLETEDGVCKIRELLPGGPAARSGLLKPGDSIVAVAQAGKDPVDIVNMPLSRTVQLIRGPKGSTVILTVMPMGAAEASPPKAIFLVRAEINLEDGEAKARIVDLPASGGGVLRLGVIDLPSFYADMGERAGGGHRSATADVARLLKKLEGEHVRGLVLDLRRNGGGSLEEAVSLTGLFIHRGPVVQTRGPAGDIEAEADADPSALYDGPLILLTSRFSASASEILAGALQDYGRAVIVGDSSTFGKGTVQNVLPLGRVMDQGGLAHAYDPGALKITIRKFYRPDGASTQLRGVASDIVLPSTSDVSEVGESALKNPLPWDAVPPAPHEAWNRVQPYVGLLKERSAPRVTVEKAFNYVRDDVARLRKSLDAKTVSLNEAERRQELAEARARQSERDRESHASSSVPPATYEITLKNVASPGLPPPVSATRDDGAGRRATTSISPGDPRERTDDHWRGDDVILTETEHILADYVEVLGRLSKAPARASR